ncbi:hypothetical protein ACP3VZ_05865 [Vibrio sp. PNB22_2_2]|uniref:hypothetical protein n=1 Tax=unclassified Vibrio TaxID=2614977 RepID=UPI00406A8082
MDKITTHKRAATNDWGLPRFSLKTDKALDAIELTKLTSFFSLTRKLSVKRGERRSFSLNLMYFRQSLRRISPAQQEITIF